MTDAHDQIAAHRYTIHYPEHGPRESDPHYKDFHAYHRRTRATARCYVGERIGFDECCDAQKHACVIDADGQMSGLELHHTHIEDALRNGVDLKALEVDYPGVSNPDEVGAWIETAANLRWLCAAHHRTTERGVHSVAHADWESIQYLPGLTGPAEETK